MRQLTTLRKLKDGPVVVDGICVWAESGKVYAFDNRCPHLGFPMHKGSLQDGIVTCHWHQWRFDACGGGCLTEGGVDIPSYPVEVRGDEVWVDAKAPGSAAGERWQLFHEGLRESNTTKIARAVVGLVDAGATDAEIGRHTAMFGVSYRDGWSGGLTILAANLNVLASLELAREDRILGLVHAVRGVARDCEGQAPPIPVEPLPGADAVPVERLARWFRQFVDQRDATAARRCLLTMTSRSATPTELADAFLGALTDHVFLDQGHALDFAEKAFELLDRIGWKHAGPVLQSLVPGMTGAERAEEDSDWRIPVDLIDLLAKKENAPGEPSLEGLLSDEPARVLDGLAASQTGAEDRLAAAAVTRVARFHLRNEFFDWDTVHHALTYAAAARRFVSRGSGGPSRARALAHGAADVYLVRFLNMPAAPLPVTVPGNVPAAQLTSSLAEALSHKDVDAAARATASWIAAGHPAKDFWRALAHLYFIEDHEFHTKQAFEACLGLAAGVKGLEPLVPAVAVARYLAAHSPTNRTIEQAVTAAIRLGRGDRLYEE